MKRAQDWRFSSLWVRTHGPAELRRVLCDWPVDRPRNWLERVNTPLTAREIERVRLSIDRNRPLGSEPWVEKTVQRLGLQHTMRSEGRPRSDKNGGRSEN